MYIIIKKDTASHFSEKLHKAKEAICDVIEEMREASSQEYPYEEAYHHSYSHRDRMYDRGTEHGHDYARHPHYEGYRGYEPDYSRHRGRY